jgi:hypothetical protein
MKLSLLNQEQKRRQLELELEYEKKRFMDSTLETGEQIHRNYSKVDSLLKWVRNHPMQAAGLLFLGGFIASQMIQKSRTPSRDL